MKAQWLGSAGTTVLVRCRCGARVQVSRAHWQAQVLTRCDGCGAAILYPSLEIVAVEKVEELMAGILKQEQEREALLADVQRELRRFVQLYDRQPEWLWSPVTVRFVQAVRPKLELLGGPIPPARKGGEITTETAYRGGAYERLLDEEEEDLLDEEQALDEEQPEDEDEEPDAA